MSARGYYGRSRVGAAFDDLEQLDASFRQLNVTLADQVSAISTGQLGQSPLVAFFHNRWIPLYDSWRHFYAFAQVAVGPPARLIPGKLEEFKSKIVDARVDARLAASGPPSVSPSPLPPSAPQGPVLSPPAPAVEDTRGSFLHSPLGIGAVVAFAIGGTALVVAATRHAGSV